LHSEWYSCSNTLCVHLLSSHFCTRKYRQRSTILHAKNGTLTDLYCWIKIAVTPRISVRNPHGPEHVTIFFSPLIQKQPICKSDWFYDTWNRYNLFWLFCVQYQWTRMYQISKLSNPNQTCTWYGIMLSNRSPNPQYD